MDDLVDKRQRQKTPDIRKMCSNISQGSAGNGWEYKRTKKSEDFSIKVFEKEGIGLGTSRRI